MDSEALFVAFIALTMVQFLFPVLASKIRDRFKDIGYEMQSEPFWSFLNVTNFWKEARLQNQKYQDPTISKLLQFRVVWWVFTGATFMWLLISNGR